MNHDDTAEWAKQRAQDIRERLAPRSVAFVPRELIKVTSHEYLDARDRHGPPLSWLEAEKQGLVHFNAETRLVEISGSRQDIADAVHGGGNA